MTIRTTPPTRSFAAILAVAALATACSGSTTSGSGTHGTAAASATTTPSSPPSVSPKTSAPPSTSGTLTKAAFLDRANAVCAQTLTQVAKLPKPSGPTDYANIEAFAQQTLVLFPAYFGQVKKLVAQSPDQAELDTKWIDVEQSDFAAEAPYLPQLVTAARAKDAAAMSKLFDELGGVPDHSDELATFMNGYGLTQCAKLQSA